MSTKRSLDSLKNAFSQKTSGGGDQSWKLFYPFWKMPDDSVAVVRFLPDLDEDNSLGFLVENLIHELTINGERQKVPCLSMYGESCPICELSRKYYDEDNEAMGKLYYKKRSYIGQILVIESPIEHDQNQLVKLIDFGPKIFKQIQSALQSGDLDEVPFELKGGYNFRIKKTKSGQYADYGTSSFSPKPSNIDDEVIEQLKLYDLKEYRTKYVDRATLEAMLVASQTGQAFSHQHDEDEPRESVKKVSSTVSKLTQKLVKVDDDAEDESMPTPKKVVEQVKEEPVVQSTSSKAQSVLEQLRARAKAAAKTE